MKLNKTLGEMVASDSGLRERVQKVILAQTDHREFVRQGEDAKEKNEDWISKLRQENRRLKGLRDDMVTKRRATTVVEVPQETRDENYYKRQLDKLRFLSKAKKNMMKGLQDKINDQGGKDSLDEDNPLVRGIRVMENKLDKIMIKYNEAIAMKDTYQNIVKRLREERVGYDNQLTAIERSLRGKEHDFEQLLLLAHDAAHAKDNAQSQLKKFQHKRTAVRDLRDKFLEEKKDEVDRPLTLAHEENQTKPTASLMDNTRRNDYSQITGQEDTEQELVYYEQAFRKLKEVSGVNDANQIIQKFRTHSQTHKSMQDLSDTYKAKIDSIKSEIASRKSQLNEKTARGVNKGEKKKKVERMEKDAEKINSNCDKIKAKSQKTNKLLVNARAGVEHLFNSLDFVRLEKTVAATKLPLEELLAYTFEKLKQCYSQVSQSPSFNSRSLDQFHHVESAKQKPQRMNITKKEEGSRDSSDYEFDQELEQAPSKKSKPRLDKSNQLQSLVSSAGMQSRARRSLKRM